MNRTSFIRANRKNDSVVHVRLDRRTVAVLAEYFIGHEREPIGSVSQLLRVGLEELKDLLIQHQVVEDVLSVLDATETLDRLGLGNLNQSGQGKRTLAEAVSLETTGAASPFVRTRTKHKREANAEALTKTAKALMEEGVVKDMIKEQADKDTKYASVLRSSMRHVPEDLIAKEEGGDEEGE